MFRLHKALFTQIVDSFQFRVSVPGDKTIVQEFSIRYGSIYANNLGVVYPSLCNYFCGVSKSRTVVKRAKVLKQAIHKYHQHFVLNYVTCVTWHDIILADLATVFYICLCITDMNLRKAK